MIFRELDMFKYLIYPQNFQYSVFKMKVSAGLGRFNFSEIKILNWFAGGSSHATQPRRALSSFGSPLHVILLDLSQITPTAWLRLKRTSCLGIMIIIPNISEYTYLHGAGYSRARAGKIIT